MKKNILIDLTWIKSHLMYTGVAKYAYRFLEYAASHGLENNFTLMVNSNCEDKFREMFPKYKYLPIGNKKILGIPIVRTLYVAWLVRRIFREKNFDLIFCPHGDFTNMWKAKSRKITTIHDLQFQIDTKGLSLMLWKYRDDFIMKNTDDVVTISAFSRNQIRMFYPWFEGEIINLGNSVSFVSECEDRLIDNDYILYVGRICKMKNIVTLMKAYALLNGTISHKLVIVGIKNKYWDKVIQPIIEEAGIQNDVIVRSDCTEQELNSLYKHASIFIQPSLREGFGFPPIEAAVMGCPVICSTCDSLPEVTQGKAIYYQSPMNASELATVIRNVLKSPPNKTELKQISSIYKDLYGIEIVGTRIYKYLMSKTQKA